MSGADSRFDFVDILPSVPAGTHGFIHNVLIRHFRKRDGFNEFNADKPVLAGMSRTVTV